MVHNGIEYGMMQAFGEGYELLKAAPVAIDVPAAIEVWRHGSVVRSWLLDLFANALRDDPDLAALKGYAEDSGEGRWTIDEAIKAAVPVPVIASALFARFASRAGGLARHEGRRRAAAAVRRPRGEEVTRKRRAAIAHRSDALVLFGASGDLTKPQALPGAAPARQARAASRHPDHRGGDAS